jgi:hypothetical protein
MRLIVPIALATAALTLAGCLGGLGGEAVDRPVDALDLLGRAEAAAKGWNPDAVLRGVRGLAARDVVDQDGVDEEYRLEAETLMKRDESPWDGLHLVWQYSFIDPRKETSYNVLISGSGKAVATITRPEPESWDSFEFGEDKIQNWKLGSRQAMDQFRAGSAVVSQCLDYPNIGGELVLRSENGVPVWKLRLWASDYQAGEWNTSASSPSDVVPRVQYSCIRPPREGFSFGWQQLTPANPEITLRFNLELGTHETIGFHMEHERTDVPTIRRLGVTITDPDGHTLPNRLDWGCSSIRCQKWQRYGEPAVGTWDVSIKLENVAIAKFSFSWCARGLPAGEPADSACRENEMTDP